MDLCYVIDFSSLPLLDDTVTELYITMSWTNTATRLVHSTLPMGHPFAESEGFWVSTREDPARYRYPSYTDTVTRQIDFSEVSIIEEISPAVFTTRMNDGGQTYILKQVERPLYLPDDSHALEMELRVLQDVGSKRGIVRLVAALVSKSPYATDPQKEAPRVLRGLLLEHHTGGTLREALTSGKVDVPWRRWAEQLCTAVASLHPHSITHMDIKPSNIVLDKDDNLVLIDVGEAGGVTHEWLSPEMQQLMDTLSTTLQARMGTDAWAVGRVMFKMAEALRGEQQQLLRGAAKDVMGNKASLSQIATNFSSSYQQES